MNSPVPAARPQHLIRLASKVQLPKGTAGARAQQWIGYSFDALRHLEQLAAAGNEIYGAETHSVEHVHLSPLQRRATWTRKKGAAR